MVSAEYQKCHLIAFQNVLESTNQVRANLIKGAQGAYFLDDSANSSGLMMDAL